MTLTLRCYACRYGPQWHAICTDLDIAVDGPSYPNARASLADCIELYLEGVVELAPAEQRRSVTRGRDARQGTLSHLVRRDEERPRVFVLQSHVPATA